MIPQRFFITGTDTDIGKTHIATGLLRAFASKGYTTAALKPLASDCEETPAGLRNADAQSLQQAATLQFPYHCINPFAFAPAIAPHLAAAMVKQTLGVTQLIAKCQSILNCQADFLVVEGAGGWLTPLNDQETLADFVTALNLSVVLVVGMRLGCLNHALLTQQAIKNSGIKLVAWVANCLDPKMPSLPENIQTLQQHLLAPLLGVVPYGQEAEKYLEIDKLCGHPERSEGSSRVRP